LPRSRHDDLNSFRVLAIDIAYADGQCRTQGDGLIVGALAKTGVKLGHSLFTEPR